MVKFGERMATEAVPEWASAYVNYARLTELFYSFDARFVSSDPTPVQKQDFERDFLALVDDELARADAHFIKVFRDLEARCLALRAASAASPPEKEKTTPSLIETFTSPSTSSPSSGNYQSIPEGTPSSHHHHHHHKKKGHVHFATESSTTTVEVTGTRSSGSEGSDVPSLPDIAPTKPNFQDWFHEAENLERFSQLASEATRKAVKKVEKNVKGMKLKHLALSCVESRDLFTKVPDLQNMIQLVKLEYEHRFRRGLDKEREIVTRKRWTPNYRMVALAAILFVVVLLTPLGLHPRAHSCLALFALIITLWLSEAFPYFATALLIPLVAVPLGVLHDDATNKTATSAMAARMLLAKMFENVQILVLGGLTMAKALDKSDLAAQAEEVLHSRTARHPHLYMLGVMVTACVLCAFVSNVAAPVLMLGVIRRTLLRMPRGDNRSAPQRAMLLGLAFACNFGGMLSPIASPQNAVALHTLQTQQDANVGFMTWMVTTAPFVAVMLVFTWYVLLRSLRPFDHMEFVPLPDKAPGQENLSSKQRAFVVAVCGVTAFMWCAEPNAIFGGPAMIALIPIVAFFGFGILEKDDFNTLSWHLMFLLAGGAMLGLCAQSSGLLHVVSEALLAALATASPFTVIVVVVASVGVITTFVSHTVAAMVLLPLISTMHASSYAGHAAAGTQEGIMSVFGGPDMGVVLVMLAVLMCSGAMAFPISSFPNVNSLLAEDEHGTQWLAANDFIVPGTIISAVAAAVLIFFESAWASTIL